MNTLAAALGLAGELFGLAADIAKTGADVQDIHRYLGARYAIIVP